MLGLATKGEYWIFLTWDRKGRLFEGGRLFRSSEFQPWNDLVFVSDEQNL